MELFKNEESERKGKKAPSNLITFAKKDKIESKVLSSLMLEFVSSKKSTSCLKMKKVEERDEQSAPLPLPLLVECFKSSADNNSTSWKRKSLRFSQVFSNSRHKYKFKRKMQNSRHKYKYKSSTDNNSTSTSWKRKSPLKIFSSQIKIQI